jgi:hypothetical protein
LPFSVFFLTPEAGIRKPFFVTTAQRPAFLSLRAQRGNPALQLLKSKELIDITGYLT